MESTQIQQEKYAKFREWLTNNGCKITPSLIIPSLVNNNISVSTTDTIHSHKVILSVPSHLILTAEKVYKFPELKRLFSHNDDLFDYQAYDQNEFNILAVFLMYQKSKILKSTRIAKQTQSQIKPNPSFWQPYFSAASQCSTILDWPQQSYNDLPHSLKQQIVFFQIQMATLKISMVDYLSKRKQFEGVTEKELVELFDWSYKFVMTRCFGECFRTTCLIPGVDMFNHGNHIIDHQLVSMKREMGDVVDKKYKKYSGVLDLELIGGSTVTHIQSSHYEYLKQENKKDIEELLYLNKEWTYEEMNRVNKEKFKRDNIEVFDMEFYSEDDREDNDTENDEEEEREVEMTFLKEQEKQQVQEFIKEYKQFKLMSYKQSKQINQKNIVQEKKQAESEEVKQVDNNSQKQLLQQNTKIETEATQTFNRQIKQQTKDINQSSINNQNNCKQISIDTQLLQEQTKIEKQQKLQKQKSQNNSQQSSEEQDSDSDSSSNSQTPEWHNQQGTYFSLYSQYSIHPNTQLLISYGSRTNKFLLIWYGFCYPNNYYDSVSFRLDASFQNQLYPQRLIFQHYYLQIWKQRKQLNPYSNVSKQFRLKRTRINEQLIMFLRVFLMNQYKGPDQSKLMGTVPSSVQFQLFLFNYMIKLLEALAMKYPEEKIEEWRNFELIDINCKFKRIFYEQQRKIIQQHILMSKNIIQILEQIKAKEQVPMKSIYQSFQFPILRKIRKYIKLLDQNMLYIRFNPEQQLQ